MGLFNFIKNTAQGNFWTIPRNLTYAYLRLLHHKDSFDDPRFILQAASVINACDYLKKGQIRMKDIGLCLFYAERGECAPLPCMPNQNMTSYGRSLPCLAPDFGVHGSEGRCLPNGEASEALIVNYCVQHVAMLLSIDSPGVGVADLILACVEAKPTIEESIRTLNHELKKGQGESFMWNAAVANGMLLQPENYLTPYLEQLM